MASLPIRRLIEKLFLYVYTHPPPPPPPPLWFRKPLPLLRDCHCAAAEQLYLRSGVAAAAAAREKQYNKRCAARTNDRHDAMQHVQPYIQSFVLYYSSGSEGGGGRG